MILTLVSLGVNATSYDVAAYVWPAYHPAARWAELGIFKDGKGEWQNLYEAVKHYPDDYQGVKPLWGYENEADPTVVARKIDAATAAGVNVFIYDWYWYGGRPFLEEALNKGFLKAPNCERMKFYLMYANHDVTGLWNNRIGGPEKEEKVIWQAKISDSDWKQIVRMWIGYFQKPNYYAVKGCPVVSIYDIDGFVAWEGKDKAKTRLEYLRAEVRKAGFPGLHLQLLDQAEDLEGLGVNSTTAYNLGYRLWGRKDVVGKDGPTYTRYCETAEAGREKAAKRAAALGAAYFPNLTVGWDTNARFPAGEGQWIVHGANPREFEAFACRARDWADKNIPAGMPRLITVNSWNEWTEGSYLEPDDRFGYGYLNALWRVFVKGTK